MTIVTDKQYEAEFGYHVRRQDRDSYSQALMNFDPLLKFPFDQRKSIVDYIVNIFNKKHGEIMITRLTEATIKLIESFGLIV